MRLEKEHLEAQLQSTHQQLENVRADMQVCVCVCVCGWVGGWVGWIMQGEDIDRVGCYSDSVIQEREREKERVPAEG